MSSIQADSEGTCTKPVAIVCYRGNTPEERRQCLPQQWGEQLDQELGTWDPASPTFNADVLSRLLGGDTEVRLVDVQTEGWDAVKQRVPQSHNVSYLVGCRCGFQDIPSWVCELVVMKCLILRANELARLPEWIGQLKSLEVVNLSQNHLTLLPETICQLTLLQKLKLSGNQLSALPQSIGELRAVTELVLNGNQLSSLPESIGGMFALEKLYLSGNQLSSLPSSIGQLREITELYAQRNKLSSLPDSMSQLTTLAKLNLSHNMLSFLPEQIGHLTALAELSLSWNRLSILPESITLLTALTELGLSENQLSSLPDSIGQLTALTELYLSGNQLTSLPESVVQMKALNKLTLSRNQLSTIGAWIGELAALTELNLCGNQLTSLPESMSKLSSLRVLNVSKNNISELPEWIGELTELTKLDISGMELLSLPESISQLTALTSLHLDAVADDCCSKIAASIVSCLSLNLKFVPAKLRRMVEMYRQRYKRFMNEERVPLNTTKVIVCGHWFAGKTTLIEKLQGHRVRDFFQRPLIQPDDRTLGVSITRGEINHRNEKKKALFLDLGGQDTFRIFQEFLLQDVDTCVFVVVCDMGDEPAIWAEEARLNLPTSKHNAEEARTWQRRQFETWIRLIAAVCPPPSSPRILFVGTHVSGSGHEIGSTRETLQDWVGEWKTPFGDRLRISDADVFVLDCLRNAKEIEELRHSLVQCCNEVCEKVLIPKVVRFVVDLIATEHNGTKLLKWEEYSKWFQSVVPEADEERIRAVTSAIHDSGHLVWMSKTLPQYVFLDPASIFNPFLGKLFAPRHLQKDVKSHGALIPKTTIIDTWRHICGDAPSTELEMQNVCHMLQAFGLAIDHGHGDMYVPALNGEFLHESQYRLSFRKVVAGRRWKTADSGSLLPDSYFPLFQVALKHKLQQRSGEIRWWKDACRYSRGIYFVYVIYQYHQGLVDVVLMVNNDHLERVSHRLCRMELNFVLTLLHTTLEEKYSGLTDQLEALVPQQLQSYEPDKWCGLDIGYLERKRQLFLDEEHDLIIHSDSLEDNKTLMARSESQDWSADLDDILLVDRSGTPENENVRVGDGQDDLPYPDRVAYRNEAVVSAMINALDEDVAKAPILPVDQSETVVPVCDLRLGKSYQLALQIYHADLEKIEVEPAVRVKWIAREWVCGEQEKYDEKFCFPEDRPRHIEAAWEKLEDDMGVLVVPFEKVLEGTSKQYTLEGLDQAAMGWKSETEAGYRLVVKLSIQIRPRSHENAWIPVTLQVPFRWLKPESRIVAKGKEKKVEIQNWMRRHPRWAWLGKKAWFVAKKVVSHGLG